MSNPTSPTTLKAAPVGQTAASAPSLPTLTGTAQAAAIQAAVTQAVSAQAVLAQAGTPFKPIKPKFGDLIQEGSGKWAAWTGGKPKDDWTELENITPKLVAPNQFRAATSGSRAKAQYYRTQPLANKFGRDKDILTFQKKVEKHLIEHGLDTITYVPDPADPRKVISVVTEHGRLNLKEGIESGNQVAMLYYDTYDFANMEDSKQFLLNSVDEDLEKQLYENCKDNDSFVAYWLHLINIESSVSINRFDKIKDRLKARKISEYEGENIEKLCTDFLGDFKELHGAGMYDNNLTLTMLNKIMEAGGGSNEDFRHPLRSLKINLNKKLLKIRHMDYNSAHAAMITDELDVQSILQEAKDEYRALYDDKRWPAASHAKDSKAMNRNYGSVNAAVTTEHKSW